MMNVLRYLAVAVLSALMPVVSMAFTQKDTVGKITIIRTHTNSHETASVREYTIFKLDESATLDSPCTWLFIAPQDKATLSAILSAKATGNTVKVYYYTDLASPWGFSSTCGTAAVDILQN